MARVEIYYCPVGSGYDTRAVSLANELNAHGHDARALEGAKSQFDVKVEGKVVFSKQAEGRFPEHDEILAKV